MGSKLLEAKRVFAAAYPCNIGTMKEHCFVAGWLSAKCSDQPLQVTDCLYDEERMFFAIGWLEATLREE